MPFLVFSRTTLGALFLLPFVLKRGAISQLRRHWRAVLGFTIIEMVVPWGLLAHGQIKVASSTAGLLIAATLILTVLVARFSGQAGPLGIRRIIGFGLGFAGVFVLAAPEFGGDLVAMLEILAAAACYALGSIVAARGLKDISPILATGACLLLSAVLYLPAAIVTWPHALPSLSSIIAIALYEAATVIMTRARAESDLRTWGLRLREKIGFKRAAVAVARKLAVIMHAMLKSGVAFNQTTAIA